MIVQMIIGNGDKMALSSLPLSLQETLAIEMRDLRLIDKTTLSQVATEFVQELEQVGLVAGGGAENVLKTLGDHISPDLASKLRSDIANANMKDPWSMLTTLENEEILKIMQAQSTEIAAVVLSKLTVSKAAEVLSMLPGERARRITYAVSQTADIAPDAVQRIGAALVQEHCVTTAVAFEKAPVQRIGAILNSSPAKTREDMLEGLSASDAPFADNVRKAIFTFADIPERITPTDIAACIRGVSPETLTTAIGSALSQPGALEDAAEFMLSNISQRMAGQIRDDVKEMGKVKASDGDKAMNELTAAIRELVDAGTIKFIEADEEGDE